MIREYGFGTVRAELDDEAGDGVLLQQSAALDLCIPSCNCQGQIIAATVQAADWDRAIEFLYGAGFEPMSWEPIGKRAGWDAYAIVPIELGATA